MRLASLALSMLGLTLTCAASSPDDRVAGSPPDVRTAANDVVAALASHNMPRVAELTHPTRGVRFSPYPFVDTTTDRVVAARDVATLWNEATPAHWGSFDGSGEPIRLAYPAYHAKFVYDADFQHAPRVAVDSQPIGRGNTTNNVRDVYQGASVVEYYIPGRDPS